MLPEAAAGVTGRFLGRVDAALPGLVKGFYLVGSIALGGFRPGRSDIDFVATLGRPLSAAEVAALRRVHRRCYAEGMLRAAAHARPWPLLCNGVFLREADLASPPGAVRAMARQVAGTFDVGKAFDVNPVTWWTLAHGGVPVRGPAPERLAIHLDDAALRDWTAANLVSYWRPWADAVAGGGIAAWRRRLTQVHARRLAAWGVLGTARMHATIRTGTVISKEQAGEYALGVFGDRWHPVIHDALDYWRGLPARPGRGSRALRAETAAFVTHVVHIAGAV
ncbi:MAG: DUF4111 domain-containing protein [Streptosporangiaceae bacterium]|nr:DUF4111 domain-containing protein [Streptosporangiaceae bacterium]MBV9855628.1 DUF4111 domain-containing protein [Streptosporangiaceae bacterium]